jgi:hypothetical protein
MKHKMTDEMFEKASRLKDDLGTLLAESDVEPGIIISVLVAIACEAALLQAEMKPHEFLRSMANGVCAMMDLSQDAEEEDDEPTDGRENIQWLN